jgi:hypothetical protein
LRARSRDSESFSSMHCDKLPRSLTDTPPAARSYTGERHRGATKKEMGYVHAAGFADSGRGRLRWSCGVRAISLRIDTGAWELCPRSRCQLPGGEAKTATPGPSEVVNPCRQNVYNSCADECIILNVACV